MGGMTVTPNERNDLILMSPMTGRRVCMDYRKLNAWTQKDHFSHSLHGPNVGQTCRQGWYYFLDGYLGYNQNSIAPEDQEKTTFTCPYGTFAFKRMPFGLCNAPMTFQRYMMSIFSDMVEETIEVFMDDFSMDYSKVAYPLCKLLEKDCKFYFDESYLRAFGELKGKLVSVPIIISPNQGETFEVMCDVSGVALGMVLGQRRDKILHRIYYVSKALNEAQKNNTLIAKDAKQRFIRWVLLLQDFEFEVEERKGTATQMVDHFLRMEDEAMHKLGEKAEINDAFPDEDILVVSHDLIPWFADFVNYLASDCPADLTLHQRKKFLHDVKKFFFAISLT
nr:uncharacterized protein LOC101247501 [Solanum lycopersicum]